MLTPQYKRHSQFLPHDQIRPTLSVLQLNLNKIISHVASSNPLVVSSLLKMSQCKFRGGHVKFSSIQFRTKLCPPGALLNLACLRVRRFYTFKLA